MIQLLSREGSIRQKRLPLGVVALGLLLAGIGLFSGAMLRGNPAPPEESPVTLDTTSNTYVLFLDMQEVESMKNMEMVVNQAEKHPANPILPTGDLNEFDFHQASSWGGTVIYDEDEKVFKLWYVGGRGG